VSQKVLLCIDDEMNGLLVRQMLLASQGYEVPIASDPVEGLHLFERVHIDAVVLDYYMPVMNGAEVAAELKTRRPHVPIVLLSVFVTLPEEAMEHSDAYLVKGDAPKKLLRAIETLPNSAA
jgi:CheY-like chemotaxis protein